MVLEMEATEDLRGLARNGLPEIAVWGGQGQGAADGPDLLSAGCAAAVPREVAGADPGDYLRDRDAGAARDGYQ